MVNFSPPRNNHIPIIRSSSRSDADDLSTAPTTRSTQHIHLLNANATRLIHRIDPATSRVTEVINTPRGGVAIVVGGSDTDNYRITDADRLLAPTRNHGAWRTRPTTLTDTADHAVRVQSPATSTTNSNNTINTMPIRIPIVDANDSPSANSNTTSASRVNEVPLLSQEQLMRNSQYMVMDESRSTDEDSTGDVSSTSNDGLISRSVSGEGGMRMYDGTLNVHTQQLRSRMVRAMRTSQIAQQQFEAKTVCNLTCRFCQSELTDRGMRAILLGDTNVELYSTDLPPTNTLGLIGEDYTTKNCACQIRDSACLTCGNVTGYHVTRPCSSCLEACHNGHFWMLHSDATKAIDRYTSAGLLMRWGGIIRETDYTSDETLMFGSVPRCLANVVCIR
eukprot:CFRG4234T1